MRPDRRRRREFVIFVMLTVLMLFVREMNVRVRRRLDTPVYLTPREQLNKAFNLDNGFTMSFVQLIGDKVTVQCEQGLIFINGLKYVLYIVTK